MLNDATRLNNTLSSWNRKNKMIAYEAISKLTRVLIEQSDYYDHRFNFGLSSKHRPVLDG